MTMFNWNAKPGEQIASDFLWVYFVVTVPITIGILLLWLWWYNRSHKKHQDRIGAIEAAIASRAETRLSKNEKTS